MLLFADVLCDQPLSW